MGFRQVKKDKQIIEIHIPSTLGYEKVAMESVASVAKMLAFTDEKIEDLKTAVSEACINSIEHGNKFNEDTVILVTLKIDHESLKVSIADQGNGFIEPTPIPNIDNQVNNGDKRGWGIFLIKKLVDEVEFEKIPSGGSQINMVIYLSR